jgi:ABC-type multidrug transport system fused ATPase/permease subunit
MRRSPNPENQAAAKKISREGLTRFFRIFRFMWPYRTTFFIGLGALTLSSGTLLAFPYLAGKLLDAAQGKSGFFLTTVNQIALALLAVLLLQAVFSFVRVLTFSMVSEKSLADLRQRVYEKIIWLPQSFFDNHRVGELLSRLTADVGTLHDTFSGSLAELLRQALMLLIGIPLIFILTPQLTTFMLLTFPVLVLAALVFGRFIRRLSKKTQDEMARANVIVEETLQSAAVVKAFTNEALEARRYRGALQQMVNTAVYGARFRGLFISFAIFALFGGIVAVSWYGATLVQSQQISVGDMLSFVFYTTFIGGSIAGLADMFSQLQRAIGASERILEILAETDEQPATPSAEHKLSGALQFRQVSFSYPTRPDVTVLKHIDFTVAAGEKVALVGPSGSGKSTIINLLLRFYPPTGGAVFADGADIRTMNLTAYRKNIGMVPQEVILFGGSIRENIAYGKPSATEAEIIAAARQANAWEFISGFPDGLDTVVGDRGVKLSGGQRQRIAIARAILKNPAILILDEATSALDAESERLVQDALEKLMARRTTIIIAHRLSTIRKVNRILVIRNGEVAEEGSHAQLAAFDNGIYSNLLRLQLELAE